MQPPVHGMGLLAHLCWINVNFQCELMIIIHHQEGKVADSKPGLPDGTIVNDYVAEPSPSEITVCFRLL
jgi:hypothetical protein